MKKTISSVLAVAVLVALLPMGILDFTAKAEDTYKEGYYSYTVSNDEATVTWVSGVQTGDVTVPQTLGGYPVAVIGTKAFSRCDNITSVTFPDSVRYLYSEAFYDCDNIKSVYLGAGMKSISESAFSGAKLLESIYVDQNNPNFSSVDGILFSKSAKRIYKFPKEHAIKNYVVPEGVTIMEQSTFSGCKNLESVVLPSTINKISVNTFYGCENLKSITMHKTVTRISAYAFRFCYSLSDVWFVGSKSEKNMFIDYYNSDLTGAKWHYDACPVGAEHSYDDECDSVCNVCEYTRTAPHSYDDGEIIAPTITEQGYTKYTCIYCKNEFRDNFTDSANKVLGVTAKASDVDVTVSWDKYEGADRYYVRAVKPDGTILTTKTVSDGSLSAVFKGLEYGSEYSFIVYAKVNGEYLLPEKATPVKASLVMDSRVVGLSSSVKGRAITVSWLEYPNAENYYVFVYPKGADASVSANRVTTVNAGANTSVELVNAIAPETEYDIYVSAKVGGKYQSLENAVCTTAVIPVTAPNSFEITSIEPTAFRIKWNAVKNADRYWARLVDESGNIVMTKQSLKALISFTKLIPGKTYYVQLQARVPKSSGGSQYSGYCDPIMTQPITLPLK